MGIFGKVANIAKELTLGQPGVRVVKWALGGHTKKKRKSSTSRTSVDVTLRKRQATMRKYSRSMMAKKKSRIGKSRSSGKYKNLSNPQRKGRRRSTKPGIRKGITGRTYSGTPMNRAAVTAAIAEAMKKRKKK